tara:strand:+ start:9793 stop:11532 length:1740 start_codon:yes stop_codon:yes gene_type:complete
MTRPGGGVTSLQIINFGVCVDNDDPLRAGRIRAVKDQNPQVSDPVKAVEKWDKDNPNKAWSKSDEYLIAPFLPIHLNLIPKKLEGIKIMYYDLENESHNKEYIGPMISQPNLLFLDGYESGRFHTTLGARQDPRTTVTSNADSRGVYPNPNDIAIQGRKNTDIILGTSENLPKDKKSNLTRAMNVGVEPIPYDNPQILIRAGKFKPVGEDNPGEQPLINKKMSFIQINTFPNSLSIEDKNKGKSITVDDDKINVIVEYDITNFVDPVDFNDVGVELEFVLNFSLVPNHKDSKITLTQEANLDTNYLYTDNVMTVKFTLTQDDAITEINKFLHAFDQHEYSDFLKPVSGSQPPNNPVYGFNPVTVDALERKISVSGLKGHPLYFRPAGHLLKFYQKTDFNSTLFSSYGSLTSGNFDSVRSSILSFIKKIELSGVKTKGYGLAFTENPSKRTVPTTETVITIKEPIPDYTQQHGVITVGTDKIYLLSHNSTELGEFKLNDNYGISQYEYVDIIEKKTEPLVRGHKLMDLMEMVVEFTISHTHSCSGDAPVPTSWGGTTVQEIENKLKKFRTEGLNNNIRIN